jgi:hypothetical protein
MNLEIYVEKILAILGAHWAFFTVAFIIAVVGEVMKVLVLGPKKKEHVGWRSVYEKTLPLHPIVVGGLLGVYLSAIVPVEVSGGQVVASVLYFALSGLLSSWLYQATKKIYPDVIRYIRNKLVVSKKGPVESDAEDGNEKDSE